MSIQNEVLDSTFKTSKNFYSSDLICAEYLQRHLDKEGKNYMNPHLNFIGEKAATDMDALSMDADKTGPQLIKRNFYGENIDAIKFHPAYDQLMQIAIDSEMFTVKWKPELKEKFNHERHALGFASGYFYAMSELGQYCPLCMTDGVARLIHLYATDADKKRLLPHIATKNMGELFTGAMFLTEKSGGSDVGRNLVRAEKVSGTTYKLYGEKWFCSNANADLIFALARTDASKPGTKGLSIFLIEKHLPDGSRNNINMIRLKDKLGVRSMASAECQLEGTQATLIGDEFQGFKIMTDMINLSRLYNAVAALSGARRALVEVFQFLRFRKSFGKFAIEHPLIREKLFELGSLHVANFYLTWRAIRALDASDSGNEKEKHLIRMLTPMVKKWSAEKAVYITRESMELMGGIGYIEDGVMPKIMRDVMVLPIWEGAGNIMTLDMLRASFKSDGLNVMLEEIKGSAASNTVIGKHLSRLSEQAIGLQKLEGDELQLRAKYFFDELTTLFQLHLITSETNPDNQGWMNPTAAFLTNKLEKKDTSTLLSVDEIKALVGWNF